MARFQPGASGNPHGRPPGAKSAVTALRKELITDADLQRIVDVVIAKALEGDLTAAGMILDRRLPRLRMQTSVRAMGGVEGGLEALVSAANERPV